MSAFDISRPIHVRLWGPRAVFTSPHLMTERMSEPVPTPSAAQRILGSIYWKPQFEWIVDRIYVLNPIRYHQMVCREVKEANRATVNGDADRTLISTTFLVDVDYVFEARIACNPAPHLNDRNSHGSPGNRAHAYRGEAIKRMSRGSQYRQPFFGKSGMHAFWELLPEGTEIQPIEHSCALGHILYDMKPIDIRRDQFEPIFFDAHLDNGVMEVPWELHRAVLPGKFDVRARYAAA